MHCRQSLVVVCIFENIRLIHQRPEIRVNDSRIRRFSTTAVALLKLYVQVISGLIAGGSFAEMSDFMPGVKVLLQVAQQQVSNHR